MSTTNAAKTHCKAGHAFDDSNTYVSNSRGSPMRQCKTCRNARARTVISFRPGVKLDDAQLRRLREAFEDGVPARDLAGRFGVHPERIKALIASSLSGGRPKALVAG